MSNKEIRNLLAELQDELHNTELDAETRSLVKRLDSDIHQLLETDTVSKDAGSIVERARELESAFASEHPTAERFMREVVETLARMGI